MFVTMINDCSFEDVLSTLSPCSKTLHQSLWHLCALYSVCSRYNHLFKMAKSTIEKYTINHQFSLKKLWKEVGNKWSSEFSLVYNTNFTNRLCYSCDDGKLFIDDLTESYFTTQESHCINPIPPNGDYEVVWEW